MADNYIERQQEQYEARKAAWKQAQKYGKKKLTAVRPAESKSHTSTVSKPEDSKRRVFITGGAEGIGKQSHVPRRFIQVSLKTTVPDAWLFRKQIGKSLYHQVLRFVNVMQIPVYV